MNAYPGAVTNPPAEGVIDGHGRRELTRKLPPGDASTHEVEDRIQDRDAACRLLVALRAKFSTISLIWADAGYAGRLVTWAKEVLGMVIAIVKRSDDVTGFMVLPRRWVVERSLAWITKFRRCVRDYETLPATHEAMVYISSIMTMSRRLARTGDWG